MYISRRSNKWDSEKDIENTLKYNFSNPCVPLSLTKILEEFIDRAILLIQEKFRTGICDNGDAIKLMSEISHFEYSCGINSGIFSRYGDCPDSKEVISEVCSLLMIFLEREYNVRHSK